ncbi:MAG: protein-export chaperone SecB [Rickettsiales bacterium]
MADDKNKKTTPEVENYLNINAQYIKDLSFENPKAPMSFTNTEQPKMDVNVDLNVQKFDNDLYEVSMAINVAATVKDETVFIVELNYAGLFTAKFSESSDLEKVLLVQCPHILFPYARRIISDTTRDGGYAPLYINPIDFMYLYMENKDKIKKAQSTETPANIN